MDWNWWRGLIGTIVVEFLTLAAFWLAWWLWWSLPKKQVEGLRLKIRDPKARADLEDSIRKTMGQLIGGAAVLIGAGVAYYQTQRTLDVSDRQSQRSLQASRDLIVSQQVSKGFEQLSNKDSAIMRLGGIYTLEGVMKESEQYHQPVLEALCAFVRDVTQDVTSDARPATEVQAALTVIGRRIPGNGGVDLDSAHIPYTFLFHANLQFALLRGANLRPAQFFSSQMHQAYLDHTRLNNADLHDTNLGGASLIGADLSDANLHNTDLSGANLSGANLSNVDLTNTNLSGANLSNTQLFGIRYIPDQLGRACGSGMNPPSEFIKPCANSKEGK